MQHLTVREALTVEGLQHARVLAGAAGLDRAITFVNVMEVPDILDWVKPGEVLVPTTYPLRDARSSLRDLIPRLNDKGLAGIAIKPQRYLDAVPAEILTLASELGFPVLELPPATAFAGVMLSGGGLAEIAALLAGILQRPVSILGGDGECLAMTGPPPGLAADVTEIGVAPVALLTGAEPLPAGDRGRCNASGCACRAGRCRSSSGPFKLVASITAKASSGIRRR
jgi:hypothetical protein